MASPRRHSTLIELIRDRPSSMGSGPPVRAERVKPEPMAKPRKERAHRSSESSSDHGFDIAALGKFFAAGRRLTFPMGYVFIAAALVLISWIGVYMIGYSRAESAHKNEQIARLTSSSDPLLTDSAPITAPERRLPTTSNNTAPRTNTQRPVPQVSSDGPTGAGLPNRAGSTATRSRSAAANQPASVLPPAVFELDNNYLVIANYHRDEAQLAATFLNDNGVRATIAPSGSGSSWHVLGLRGFTSDQMRAGEHRQYREQVENLGRSWERNHGGSDNFSQMFFRKEKG